MARLLLCAATCTLTAATSSISALLGNGKPVDWFFAFKLNTAFWPDCKTNANLEKCIFGGKPQDYRNGFGLQYLLASHANGKTAPLQFHGDCLGSGEDPVAQTFKQVFSGKAPNYVIWNDQFYGDPIPQIHPACDGFTSHACPSPWGHSKGVLAWDNDGTGFIMQVSTPSWPGNGDKSHHRKTQGNTLGCIDDDNAKVSQHFFALSLKTPSDTKAVLQALQLASVATDPKNTELMKLSPHGPDDLSELAKNLGKVSKASAPSHATLARGRVQLVAKPHALAVPPWQMVSSVLQQPVRCGTWWATPKILSSKAGEIPGCWDSSLHAPKEVQIAVTGQWKGQVMNLTGDNSPDANHAKIGHSVGGSLSIFGDMNQEGSYNPHDSKGGCSAHQCGRGGLFFAVDDTTLHTDMTSLLKGVTAPYYKRSSGMHEIPEEVLDAETVTIV